MSVWRHLRDREVVGLVGVSLLKFVILFGPQLSYLPIMMNDRFGAPSYVIGGVLLGASLTTAVVSSQLGRLAGRFSEKILLRCAFVLYAAGLALVAVTPTLLQLLVSFGATGAYLATADIAFLAFLLAVVPVR